MSLNPQQQQKITLALRAAHLAKTALEMLGTNTLEVAELQFVQVVREVKEMDTFLRDAKAGAA